MLQKIFKFMKFTGKVIKGDKEGTALGFPTANLDIEIELEPGIYAARVNLLNETIDAVVCHGLKNKLGDVKFEIHIMDYVGDLYGREISGEIVGERISELVDGLDEQALRKKIAEDIEKAKYVLRNN